MKNKTNIYYIIIIIVLTLILGILWYLIINNNTNNNQINMPGNTNSSSISYSAVKEITSNENISNEKIESTNSDENAILVSGLVTSNLSQISINKTGDSNGGDATSFYGNNSGILAKDGSTVEIKDSTITTNATGANGVFSYGGSATTENTSSDSTTINISNYIITTSKDN